MNDNISESVSSLEPVSDASDPYDDYDHEVPLVVQYWNAIVRHKLAIAVIIASTLVVGIIVTLLMTPQYSATSRIEINRSQDRVTDVEGLQAEDVGQELEFYQTQYSLLEARSLAERVARSQNLVTDNDFFEQFGVSLDDLGGGTSDTRGTSAADRRKRLEIAEDILLNNVSIAPIKGSSLVDVSFESPNAVLSAKIANAWVDQFIESKLDRRFDSTADARAFLEKELAKLRARLEESERQLVLYADNEQIVTLATAQDAEGRTRQQQTMTSADLEQLNRELAAATADRIVAQSEAAQRESYQRILENSAINGMREQRAMASAEYAKILTQFEPEYPTALALQSQIDALDDSIAREEERARQGSRARYLEALRRENELAKKVDSLKGKFSDERRASIQYNIFQREVDTNRQLYNGLLQRYKEIGVAGVGSNSIAIVDRAAPVDDPSSPSLILNTALALLFGIGCASAFVLLQEQLDQTVKDSSDLKRKLRVSPLGSIPNVDKQNILESLKDKKSTAWEAYLSVRTGLSFLTEHGVPRSFLLTSTRPNEGKSTSAFAMAAVLQSTGKKVLLIDGDMRNPSVHKMIDVKNERGLSNYLSGNDNISELLIRDDTHGFHIMPAGPIPPNAAELLSSSRMPQLIKELNQEFECVIIDAPPVLGLADIPLLSDAVEGVIFTIEVNGVKLRGIEAALQRVRAAQANIFGAIITKVPSGAGGYGYGYGYGYAYEYKYGHKNDED